jgi:hypothetical protein
MIATIRLSPTPIRYDAIVHADDEAIAAHVMRARLAVRDRLGQAVDQVRD